MANPQIVTIHEAKTHLSELIRRVSRGEVITIVQKGAPVARLVPALPERPERKPGSARGLVTISDDFDAPLLEDLKRRLE